MKNSILQNWINNNQMHLAVYRLKFVEFNQSINETIYKKTARKFRLRSFMINMSIESNKSVENFFNYKT